MLGVAAWEERSRLEFSTYYYGTAARTHPRSNGNTIRVVIIRHIRGSFLLLTRQRWTRGRCVVNFRPHWHVHVKLLIGTLPVDRKGEPPVVVHARLEVPDQGLLPTPRDRDSPQSTNLHLQVPPVHLFRTDLVLSVAQERSQVFQCLSSLRAMSPRSIGTLD